MRNVVFVTLLFILLISMSQVRAERSPFSEDYYNRLWCADMGGIPEYRLNDKKRVDCLTDKVAYEADWGKKWAESIGQSLAYGVATNRRSGILLLIRNMKDVENLDYIRWINKKKNLNIDIQWMITPERTEY